MTSESEEFSTETSSSEDEETSSGEEPPTKRKPTNIRDLMGLNKVREVPPKKVPSNVPPKSPKQKQPEEEAVIREELGVALKEVGESSSAFEVRSELRKRLYDGGFASFDIISRMI